MNFGPQLKAASWELIPQRGSDAINQTAGIAGPMVGFPRTIIRTDSPDESSTVRSDVMRVAETACKR